MIGEIRAHDGDAVKAGDVLVRLDDTVTKANLAIVTKNLDAALARAARERGAIVVVVAHRPIGIEAVDQLLVLKDGRVQAFGPKETVLGQVLQPRVAAPSPIKIVSDGGVAKP